MSNLKKKGKGKLATRPDDDHFAQPNAKPGDKGADVKQDASAPPTDDEPAMRTVEEDDFRKPAAAKSLETQTEDEDRKLASLKKKVAKKAKAQEEKQKKGKGKKGSKPETVKQKPKKTGGWAALKNTFKKFESMFGDKTEKNAETKTAGEKKVRNLEDGDDVMPASNPKKAQEDRGDNDVWIDDPAWLTNKKHRADLVLVTTNSDNNGQLFHEGKRPFWKNRIFLKEIPPPPAEKAVSKLMMQVVRDEISLAEPILEPDMDYTDNLEELMAKDAKWFKEENVLSNTIRSAVVSLDTQSMFPMPVLENPKPLETQEPAVMKVYVRMRPEIALKDEPFKKAPPGKPKRIREKNSNSRSSTDSEK